MDVDWPFGEGQILELAVHRAVGAHRDRELSVAPHNHRVLRESPSQRGVVGDHRLFAEENREGIVSSFGLPER